MLPLDRRLGGNSRHSEADVPGWAKRLRYFHFMGEVLSGHFETYEELKMRLDYSGRDDLIRLFEAHFEKLGLQSRASRRIAKDFNCVSAENFPEHFAGLGR